MPYFHARNANIQIETTEQKRIIFELADYARPTMIEQQHEQPMITNSITTTETSTNTLNPSSRPGELIRSAISAEIQSEMSSQRDDVDFDDEVDVDVPTEPQDDDLTDL